MHVGSTDDDDDDNNNTTSRNWLSKCGGGLPSSRWYREDQKRAFPIRKEGFRLDYLVDIIWKVLECYILGLGDNIDKVLNIVLGEFQKHAQALYRDQNDNEKEYIFFHSSLPPSRSSCGQIIVV